MLRQTGPPNESGAGVAPVSVFNSVRILQTSSRLTLINVASVGLNFLGAVFVANRLGPEIYGRISFVLLWVSYAGLVRPGFFEGGQRELIDRLGKSDVQGSRGAQNVGATAELIWSLLPATLLASAAGSSDPIRHTGFLLAPIMYLGLTVTRIMGGLSLAHQDFRMFMAACLLRALVQPALLIALVHSTGPYTLIVTPAIVECGIGMFYLWKARKIGIAWQFERTTARQLLQTGFPLSLSAIVYWAYRLVGPTSVGTWLPAAAFGGYIFASRLIDLALRFFGDFAGVLMPSLWGELGRAGRADAMWPEISRISLFLGVLSCVVCNLIQACIALPVFRFFPRFSSSVPILETLAFNTVLLTVTILPTLLLDSAVVNRQWRHLGIWSFGLVLNYGVNYVALRFGHGVLAIAWNDIGVQLVVGLLFYAAAHRYLFRDFATSRRLYVPLVGVLAVCGLTYLLLHLPFLSGNPPGDHRALLVRTLARIGLVIAIWGPTSLFLYRRRNRIQLGSGPSLPAANAVPV